jgi:zinc/manganese transport system ATP-binding protein
MTVPRSSDEAPLVPLITACDAAVRFANRVVWSGVTFQVDAGEFVAVLGPNGVGKSTLLKALLGLVPVSEGAIRIQGAPPRHGSPDIGYLPQRRSFDASVRIRGVDVVRLGLDGDRFGVPLPGWLTPRGRAASRRVDELLELVDASSYAQRPIGSLSGGEQQRLLIAQALARHPTLLLLDEPLDSLDLPSEAAIASLLGRICREGGVTVVIVAHDVNPILSHLHRVVYMAGGRAVAGRPNDVITSETLSVLYGAPIEVLHTTDGLPVVVGQPDAASYHPGLHGERERHLHG